MRAAEDLGRYRLLDLVAADPSRGPEPSAAGVLLWRGYDQVLDRPVAVRTVPIDDPRCADVLAAARSAAGVDDRRLLRVLDTVDLPATGTDPARVALVTEWASGRNLDDVLADRHGTPLGAAEALALVTEVARAVAAGLPAGVTHGRLRPASVFVTDAGEIRVRGLAVDAALFGPPLPEAAAVGADVDALGALTYLLTTGHWPGAQPSAAPPAPRKGTVVLPPSQVRAGVPRIIDDVVARSLAEAGRPRGIEPVRDAAAFAAMTGAGVDHLVPVTTTTIRPVTRPSVLRRIVRWSLRLVAVAVGVVLVAALARLGWTMTTALPPRVATVTATGLDPMLTSPARPADDLAGTGIERTYPITKFRSYDPFGDDNGDGRPDRRRGQENEDLAATVNDENPDTAWLTAQYSSPDLDGKGGTGLVVDLGQPQDVRGIKLNLVGSGSGLDIRVADRVLSDPALWTQLAAGFAPRDRIDMRAPRPVTGRYVLIWFTRVPPALDAGAGVYQGGVRSVVVSG